MASMTWVDGPPPASGHRDVVWGDRVDELIEEPGKWARFGPYAAASIARSVKNAVENKEGVTLDDFEITTRTEDAEDGEQAVFLYARYKSS